MIQEEGLLAHYTKKKYLTDILAEGSILLSPVCEMDDPRESNLDWIHTIGLGLNFNKSEWKKAEEIKRSVGNKLRIFCTVQPKVNKENRSSSIDKSIYCRSRMWSQYGENFEGFCVLFDKKKLISTIEGVKQDNDFLLHDSVSYPHWLHSVHGGVSIEYGQNISLDEKDTLRIINKNNMLSSIYFKKGIDWKDESEYRWLYYSEKTEDILVNVKKAIHSVVLGNKFPIEDYDIVKKYCEDLNSNCYSLTYQHPRYRLIQIL